MNTTELLEKLFPTPKECRVRVQELRSAYPHKSMEALAEIAIKHGRRRAATVGAMSGFVANPVTMAPAAILDICAVLRTEAKLAGVIAALLDPDSLNDEESFKTDILAIVFPAAIRNALQSLGVQAGRQTSKVLVRKYVSKGVLKAVVRFAIKYLGIKLTQRAIITKVVPIVGATIGGSWNWAEVKLMGRRALAYHQNREIPIWPEPESSE